MLSFDEDIAPAASPRFAPSDPAAGARTPGILAQGMLSPQLSR